MGGQAGKARGPARVGLVRSVAGFALVSGTGLAIDFTVFLALTHAAGAAPAIANAVGGACAVTFVFFASVHRVFRYNGAFLLPRFAAYMLYQVAGVAAASLTVGWLAAAGVAPWAAKLVILPVTFSCNYLFMRVLTREGGSGTPSDAPY